MIRSDLRAKNLRVTVTGLGGGEFAVLPAEAVRVFGPLDGFPVASDAPAGEGPLFVVLVRATKPPEEE